MSNLPIEKGPKDDNDLLWLLAGQVWEAGIWDDLLHGLNDKGKKDLFNFVRNILYVNPDFSSDKMYDRGVSKKYRS